MICRLSTQVALVLLAGLTLAPGAYAASASAVLTVESVLSPAWVEHANGRRDALAVGMALGNKEKVHTGDGGRALLRLADGSGVKLGESALLAVDDLAHMQEPKSGSVVSASLEVVRGAFRFTTGLLGASGAQRDVRVKVNVLTAGIRGTDVWGKAAGDRDIVCLIEGRITVNHGAAEFVMQQPLSFYVVPRTGQAQPPSPVPLDLLKVWAEETEIGVRTGAGRRGGAFSVTVSSSTTERAAVAQRDKLRESGFPAGTARVGEGAGMRYAVVIGALPESADAATLAERLRALGFAQARPAR